MCLLITAFAAAVTIVIRLLCPKSNDLKISMLSLMYLSAALMWLIDSFFSLAEGGPFLDLSASDALLGLIVTFSGLAVWCVMLLIKKRVYADKT